MSPRRRKKHYFLNIFFIYFKHTELGRMVNGVTIHENNLHVPKLNLFLIKNFF